MNVPLRIKSERSQAWWEFSQWVLRANLNKGRWLISSVAENSLILRFEEENQRFLDSKKSNIIWIVELWCKEPWPWQFPLNFHFLERIFRSSTYESINIFFQSMNYNFPSVEDFRFLISTLFRAICSSNFRSLVFSGLREWEQKLTSPLSLEKIEFLKILKESFVKSFNGKFGILTIFEFYWVMASSVKEPQLP